MTSQSPRIYTYKITFEEVPYYYYGVHKEKVFNEEYWGSPKTNKWCWELYTPKKQILEFFEFSDEGWMEALDVEKKLIKQFYNSDKWCLNESCGGYVSLNVLKLAGKKGGKRGGQKAKELKLGFHSLTLEQRRENGRKYGTKSGKMGTKEDKSKAGKIAGQKNKENKIGICGLSLEQRRENVKITNSQMWECTVTGYKNRPGPLTRYQKKRGIDTSKRIRIS
jgi:hypothetical protein